MGLGFSKCVLGGSLPCGGCYLPLASVQLLLGAGIVYDHAWPGKRALLAVVVFVWVGDDTGSVGEDLNGK